MGFFKEIDCPRCRTSGALKFLWMVKCPRRGCSNYSPDFEARNSSPVPGRPIRSSGPRGEPRGRSPRGGDIFSPGEEAVEIRYTNHRGEEKTFRADGTSIRARGRFISARLAPTGRRCAFRRERVSNMAEIEPQIDAASLLSPVERQILGYHRKYGTTSARYEQVKKKLSPTS
jgi:hypothetical protein